MDRPSGVLARTATPLTSVSSRRLAGFLRFSEFCSDARPSWLCYSHPLEKAAESAVFGVEGALARSSSTPQPQNRRSSNDRPANENKRRFYLEQSNKVV